MPFAWLKRNSPCPFLSSRDLFTTNITGHIKIPIISSNNHRDSHYSADDKQRGCSEQVHFFRCFLSILGCLGFVALSVSEHSKSVAPSLIPGFYLTLSTLIDAVRLRTLWLKPAPLRMTALFTASLALEMTILIFRGV